MPGKQGLQSTASHRTDKTTLPFSLLNRWTNILENIIFSTKNVDKTIRQGGPGTPQYLIDGVIPKVALAELLPAKLSFGMTMTRILRPVFV